MRRKETSAVGRKKRKNPLAKSNHRPSRRDFIDYDYIHKLNDEEIEMLKKFTDEYYGGYGFNKDEKGNYVNNVHESTEMRRECYRRNKRQRLDLFSYVKHGNRLASQEELENVSEDWFDTILTYAELEEFEKQAEQANQSAKNKHGTTDKTNL